MASKYDLTKDEDMASLRKACKIPKEIILQPFVEGETVSEGSTVVNSYLLRRVGLMFPLSAFLCLILRLLAIPLNCCKPNLLRLVLGVEAINRKLRVNLGINHILTSYNLAITREMASFHLKVSGLSLLEGLNYHNRDWEQFPKLVVSGPWMVKDEDHLPLPLVLDASITHGRVGQFRRSMRSFGGDCQSLVNKVHEAQLYYEQLIQVAEYELHAPPMKPVPPPGFPLIRRSSARLRDNQFRTPIAVDEGMVFLSDDSDHLGRDDPPAVRTGPFEGSTHERGQSSREGAGEDTSISQLIENLFEEVRDLKRRCLALEEENIDLNRLALENYAATQNLEERMIGVELKTDDL